MHCGEVRLTWRKGNGWPTWAVGPGARHAERNYWSEEMNHFWIRAQGPRLLWKDSATNPFGRLRPGHQELGEITPREADLVANYRIVLPDGTVRDIHILGHPVLDDTGELLNMSAPRWM